MVASTRLSESPPAERAQPAWPTRVVLQERQPAPPTHVIPQERAQPATVGIGWRTVIPASRAGPPDPDRRIASRCFLRFAQDKLCGMNRVVSALRDAPAG